MSDVADESSDEASAVAGAALRAAGQLIATAHAAARHADLDRGGGLGRGMTLERVQRSQSRLQQHGDPLGLMRNDTPAPAPTRTNAPTPERLREIETAIEIYATTVAAGRDLAREAWRVVPVVEHMQRRGQLTDTDTRAAETFYRDFVLGHRIGGLTSRYGERAGTGGTPLSQLASSAGTTPDETRAEYHRAFIDACRAINHMPTVEWMVRIICEQLLAAEPKPPTLADAGRAYMGYRDAKQAQAVGATLIKTGLERLALHYGKKRAEATTQRAVEKARAAK